MFCTPWAKATLIGLLACATTTCRPTERMLLDMTEALAVARRQPAAESFSVAAISIDGLSLRSVVAASQSRLTFHVTVPGPASFRVRAGIHPEAWSRSGAGEQFLVGVSDGHVYRQAAAITLDPAVEGGRHWKEISVDLRQYVGLTVDVVLNTRLAGEPSAALDVPHAVWGAPAVVSR